MQNTKLLLLLILFNGPAYLTRTYNEQLYFLLYNINEDNKYCKTCTAHVNSQIMLIAR